MLAQKYYNNFGTHMSKSNKATTLKRSLIALACLSAINANSVLANEAVIQGKITDENKSVFFQGAQITIKELNLTAISNRDGSFRFANLPQGQYTLVIKYLGAATVEKVITVSDGAVNNNEYVLRQQSSSMDNMIVYGQRAGQAGALNRQKNANRLTSIVSADAIGQLPDQNAAEALQRLPGISIARDQGEGRFVGIRGIDPNLNNVTINGANVPSPEAGIRSVAMDVIPSELIQSLEVSKTVTPDMDASAVGGSIEVKSLSAFDRAGQSYSFTGQASYNELTSDTSPKLSGSYSDVFDLSGNNQLGVAAALSWFERKFGSHNVETDGGWAEFEFEDLNTGEDVEQFGAEEIEQRAYEITRERLGAAVNFDLVTSATDKYYLRTLYSQFSDDEYRQRNEYKFDKGLILASSATDTSAQFEDAEMDRDTKDRYEEQEIFSAVTGGENIIGDWLIEYQASYSKSSEEQPNRIDASFAGEEITMGYQSAGDIPRLTQSANAHDLNNFEFDEIVLEDTLSEDKETSFRLDLTKEFVWRNHNGAIKFGGKYRSREKFNRANITVFDGGFNDATAQQFSTSTVDWDLGNFGPGLSQKGIRQFFNNNRSNLEINTLDTKIDSLGQSYQSNEDISALYAMVTLDINNWHIVTGVRYEDTSFDTTGNKVELVVDDVNDDEYVNVTPWQVKQDYDHLLPSLNVKYTPNDQWVARFAYTNTIARPKFSDSAAFQLIENEITEDDGVVESERKAEVGNPQLKPLESTNIDFSLEYYPGHIGVLSAGLFYKDIDNYIKQAEVQDNGQWDGFKEVVQQVNGGSASLTGLELAWNKSFDSGVLLGLNGTFVDTDDQLPNQSDTIANAIIGFENDVLSTRLSASYKSKSYQFDDGGVAVYGDDHLQLDISAKYYLTDTINVFFNAVNLTDEPMYLYHGHRNFNYQYEEYGRSFELGITINSL